MLIRKYERGDEAGIITLFRKVFGKELPLKVWQWKYSDESEARESKIFVAVENETVVGHVAVLIFPARYNNKNINVALRIDTMVDPEYRGRGLYQRLTNMLLKDVKEHRKDISFLYGLPAEKAKHVLVKSTGAEHLGDLTRKIKVNLIKKNKCSYRSPDRGEVLEEIHWFDDRFDQFEQGKEDPEAVTLRKNHHFLNWRYIINPSNEYKIFAISEFNRIKGYVVLKMEVKKIFNKRVFVGFIVDWNVLKNEDTYTFEKLLNITDSYLKQALFIQVWEPANPTLNNVLKKHLYINKRETINPLVVHSNNDNTAGMNFSDWGVKMGDVDSF